MLLGKPGPGCQAAALGFGADLVSGRAINPDPDANQQDQGRLGRHTLQSGSV